MARWPDLEAELAAWAAGGRTAAFWWRDDDARTTTPALDRLLALAEDAEVPLTLAVVPADADRALVRRLDGLDRVDVAPHGLRHANHAPADQKKAEFGAHRATDLMRAEIGEGWRRLQALFGDRARPVFVPPWNRVAPDLVDGLAALGFAGLSRFGGRARPAPAPGLTEGNCHIDVINWRHGGGFVGTTVALDQVVTHLSNRRLGAADPAEPTGLMTHHLAMDEDCWVFTAQLIDFIKNSETACWYSMQHNFGLPA